MTEENKEKFKVWKIDDKIIAGKFWGDQNEEDAKNFIISMYKLNVPKEKLEELTNRIDLLKRIETIKDFVEEINNFIPNETDILIDASKGGKSSSEARKIYVEFARTIKKGRVAIFGTKTLIKVIASFVVGAAGRENVKFFSTEEESLRWLKGN